MRSSRRVGVSCEGRFVCLIVVVSLDMIGVICLRSAFVVFAVFLSASATNNTPFRPQNCMALPMMRHLCLAREIEHDQMGPVGLWFLFSFVVFRVFFRLRVFSLSDNVLCANHIHFGQLGVHGLIWDAAASLFPNQGRRVLVNAI